MKTPSKARSKGGQPPRGHHNRIADGNGGSKDPVTDREVAARLRRVNLDLLPILDQLLRSRSVTRTARYFGMTQPAISRALRQLRETFEDDLLVPHGRDGRLTARAQALMEPLRAALKDLDGILQPMQPFDPLRETVHFTISTADYVAVLLAPTMAEICATEAPGMAFEFVERAVSEAGDLDRLDCMIAPRAYGETLGKRVASMPLWQDDIVCIVPAKKRSIPDPISPEAFQAMRHVGFHQSPRVPQRIRNLVQPTAALETDCVCTARNFLVLGAIVESADCIALVPRKVARELLRSRRLRIVDIDYEPTTLHLDAYWSPAANNKRGHAWFRNLLTRAAERIA